MREINLEASGICMSVFPLLFVCSQHKPNKYFWGNNWLGHSIWTCIWRLFDSGTCPQNSYIKSSVKTELQKRVMQLCCLRTVKYNHVGIRCRQFTCQTLPSLLANSQLSYPFLSRFRTPALLTYCAHVRMWARRKQTCSCLRTCQRNEQMLAALGSFFFLFLPLFCLSQSFLEYWRS